MFQRPPLMPSPLDKANDQGPSATDYQPGLARTSSSSSSSSSSGNGNGHGNGNSSNNKGHKKSSKSTMSKFRNGNSSSSGSSSSSSHHGASNATALRNIVPLHSQSSLLDMTHEEDDVSIDMEHYHTTHSHNLPVAGGGPSFAKDVNTDNANDTAVTAESSMMEKSMNISESLTSSFSFCCNTSASIPHDNDDTIQDENSRPNQQQQKQQQNQPSSRISDTLLQKRVLEDFHYLLGSNVMPCCVEKSLLWGDDSMMSSCGANPFGRNYCHDPVLDGDGYNAMHQAIFEDEFKIRNRAGESWRARAYRIKRLREERSRASNIQMPDLSAHTTNSNGNGNSASCRNLHQASLHSSHPMEGFAEENVHVGARAHGFGATIHSSNPALTKSTSFGQAHAIRIQPSVSWYDLSNGFQGVGNMRSSQFQRGTGASRKPKQEVNVEPLGCMIGDCIEPISPMGDGDDRVEMELRDNHRQEYLDEEDLCYDSDPGMPYTQLEMDFMNININGNGNNADTEAGCHSDAGTSATGTSVGLDKAVLHGRSKSETIITPGSPTPSPFSPKKKWFRSPRRRRRKMHFDSFDDSLDSEQKSESASASGSAATRGRNNTAIGKSDSFDGSNNARNNFYGNGNATSGSGSNLTDASFDEFDINFKVDYGKKKLGIMDSDRDIVDHVQDSLNNTWTLTWHPPVSDRSEKAKSLFKNQPNSMSTPTTGTRCIQVWFERGNRIRRNDILEPKLMWRDAYHPDLASTRTLNRSTTQGPYKICLLSICRILEAHKIDRTKYPFAKKSCSFMIKTSDDEEFVFEASTPKQRDLIVNTWKLVVARLASQAVVGDGEGMVGEFFVSSAFGVP